MSIEAMSWALRVPVGGNVKVVLLGLANHAHHDGGEAYPALDTLATYANCDRSTARRCVRRLEEEGWIRRDGLGPRGQAKYVLSMGGSRMPPPPVQGGGADAPEGVAPVPPEPSLNRPSLFPGANAPAERPVAKPPITYKGKRVPREVAIEAASLLAVFGEATGRRIAPRAGDGRASPALRQIIGAMQARPDTTPAEWEGAIRNTVENPPSWVDGAVQIGTVFGPRAAEIALSNGGRRAEVVRRQQAKDPAKQQRVDEFMDALASFTEGGS